MEDAFHGSSRQNGGALLRARASERRLQYQTAGAAECQGPPVETQYRKRARGGSDVAGLSGAGRICPVARHRAGEGPTRGGGAGGRQHKPLPSGRVASVRDLCRRPKIIY